jgi:hypothetical protein
VSRLRIRIELSRGGVGVPLHKLASVISETQRFLTLLAEDVGIENGKGEWLGFDFDPASLDFTAEYIGPVKAEQVQAFNAAFEGTTSLRRATIAQFARITESIREDEVVGFGLFTSDEGDQPSEWHCLSRRDALRIAGEIQVLLNAAGEAGQPSHLPAVRDPNLESRAFAHRRERGADTAGVVEYVRNVEANLSGRIHRLEDRVEQHSGVIRNLEGQWGTTEASLRNLVSNIETFCEQASRQIERVAPAALPAASSRRLVRRWWPVAAAAAVLVVAAVLFGTWSWGSRPARAPESVQASAPAAPPAAAAPAPAPAPPPPAVMRIDLEALDTAWVSLLDAEGNQLIYRTLQAGDTRSVEVADSATLRTGNAGALRVRLDGKPIGPLGPAGGVREVLFSHGTYRFPEAGGRDGAPPANLPLDR